jgi:hypothetical protein
MKNMIIKADLREDIGLILYKNRAILLRKIALFLFLLSDFIHMVFFKKNMIKYQPTCF